MAILTAYPRPHRIWDAVVCVLGLLLLATAVGLMTGLALVHVLSLLGMHVDTATGHIIQQVFS